MKLTFRSLLVWALLLLVAVSVLHKTGKVDTGSQLLKVARQHLQKIDPALLRNDRQQGSIQVGTNKAIHDRVLNRQLRAATDKRKGSESTLQQLSHTFFWDIDGIERSAATARALNLRHYFANSYLIGFQPFPVAQNWMPLYVVAGLKTYQYDREQYGGEDVWQNSAQAYYHTRGDCEDHAVLLADWLISCGVDARVVLGKYRNSGHAWVVALIDKKAFILEATDKRKRTSWQAYPLASLAPHYRATFMFNRRNSWVNHKPKQGSDYFGSHWQPAGRFTPDALASDKEYSAKKQ